MSKKRKAVLGSLVLGLVAVGVTTFLSPRAEARPRLLCGPTLQWSCSGPGGPDHLFIGTLCEKARFERKTGLTCTPLGG